MRLSAVSYQLSAKGGIEEIEAIAHSLLEQGRAES
jgi:hypothetical protein